jgi:hypothetical protein
MVGCTYVICTKEQRYTMPASKRYTSDPENVRKVLELYRSEAAPTLAEIAVQLETHYLNVQQIVADHLPDGEKYTQQHRRRSRATSGERNSMYGRRGVRHPRYMETVDTGDGYLYVHNSEGKLVRAHRHAFAQELGLEALPECLEVHHIDGNKHNNGLDNLALTTKAGHLKLHSQLHTLLQSLLVVNAMSTTSP